MTHEYIYAYIYITQVYIHRYIHTYLHKYIHTQSNIYIHSYINIYKHTYINTYVHTDYRQPDRVSQLTDRHIYIEED